MTLLGRLICAALLLGGLWRAGVAQQPISQGVPPVSRQTAQELFADFAEDEEAQLPEFQVEVIAFAYEAFDPAEERFPSGPRHPAEDNVAPGERQLPSFGFSEETMETLFGNDDESAPGDALTAVELFQFGQPEGVEELEQQEADDPLDAQATSDSVEDETSPGVQGDLTEFTTGERETDRAPFRFRLLTPEELELTDAFETLQTLSAYTPLVHGGWVQQGLPEEEAYSFDLSLLGTINPKGTIKLHLSRFLHLTIDLRYYAETRRPPPVEQQRTFPFTFPGPPMLEELDLALRYELMVQRRTRSGELHYFDHPAFGVLVMVRPNPEEPEGSEELPAPAA